MNCLSQVDNERVRYDGNDNRVLSSPKFLFLGDGTRVKLPWLWAGFDRTWCYRRAAEAKRQLDEGGIETILRVDRMRLKVVNFMIEQVNINGILNINLILILLPVYRFCREEYAVRTNL